MKSRAQKRLEKVQDAIDTILMGGQEYLLEVSTSDGKTSKRRLTRANLSELQALESKLQREVNLEQGTTYRVRI